MPLWFHMTAESDHYGFTGRSGWQGVSLGYEQEVKVKPRPGRGPRLVRVGIEQYVLIITLYLYRYFAALWMLLVDI